MNLLYKKELILILSILLIILFLSVIRINKLKEIDNVEKQNEVRLEYNMSKENKLPDYSFEVSDFNLENLKSYGVPIISKEHCDKLKQMTKFIQENDIRCNSIKGDELDDYFVIQENYCNIEKINSFNFS